MQQTLFFIPPEFAGIPTFGFGWFLGAWILIGLVWFGLLVRKQGWNEEAWSLVPFWALVSFLVVFVAPRFQARGPGGELLGLPVRGYGTLVLIGFGAGFWLSLYRAQKRRVRGEVISALAIWMFVGAFIGARLFFVIEYWHEFQKPTWTATLFEVFKITEGGLVVYGALLGGLPALYLFCRRHQIPALLLCDIVAPGLALGLAFGRIGCLMNGCCYGGICEAGPVSTTFPKYNAVAQRSISPPYMHQLSSGRLHGFKLGGKSDTGEPIIESVELGGPAAKAGLQAGEQVLAINSQRTDTFEMAREVMAGAGPTVAVTTVSGKNIQWSIGSLPPRSRPVHPAQIYSAVNALLLCLLLVAADPFLHRVGSTLALTLTIYPVLRIIEEVIRVDEPGQFGTTLSISQIISVILLGGAAVLWVIVYRTKET